MTMNEEYAEIFDMKIRFSGGDKEVEGELFSAKTVMPWDYRVHLATEFAKSGRPAIVHNTLGSWFRSLAALKVAGIKEATIVIPRGQNFLLTPTRTAVIVEEEKIVFLPIYKCGTSSFRALAHATFKEFAERDPADSTSLNRSIDPRAGRYDGYKKFTFVRQPMDRFGSFFRDKLLAPAGTPNHEHFVRPISILMDGHISARTAAEFISLNPPEFCDPHIKPQWMTITYRDVTLADHVFRLGDAEALKKLGLSYEFPKKLSTAGRKKTYSTDETISDAEEIIRKYYVRDYRIWRNT